MAAYTGLKDHKRRKIMKSKKGALYVKTMNGKVYGNKAAFRGNGRVASVKGIPRKVRPKKLV